MSKPLHAHGVWVGRCGKPGCIAVHIDLIDEDGDIIACAAIPFDKVKGFTESVRDCAYAIATEQSDG